MPPAAPVDPTTNSLPESSLSTVFSPERTNLENNRRFWDLRGVQWRTDLGILPTSSSSSVDDLRRVTANSRRSYAALRRQLLLDPLIPKDGSNFPDLVMDNPLSQDPDSMWGRFFQKAELEKMVDQDLSRLYPEHGSYFQTPGCQGMLRRILLLWCIRHPNYGYRQGMHELLAPLLYVLQADIERLSKVRTSHEQYFTDNFDDLSFNETDSAYKSNLKKIPQDIKNDNEIQENQPNVNNLNELDPKIQTIISFSDAYGAEGELGILLSEKFIEHDAYCMFDALMNGSNGAVAMANFFSPSPQNGLPPVIEASSALYHLLSVVDSSLYTHLIELGVEPQYFALRWLRVLFGREFTLEDLLVIWDHIFSFDNNKLNRVSENDPEYGFAVLHSSRGAFIAALAVSMILYIRSSILATETATSCLQRLLNFPDDVNLGKLLKKANSLVPLAIASIRLVPVHTGGVHERSKSSGSPVSLVRDTYWEEKWCDLHKEEEKKQVIPQSQNRMKGWSEKVKLRLARTESDPSSSKAYREKAGPSRSKVLGPARPHVRRNLLDDLARQLGLEEETEKSAGENGGSEENSSIFSDPPSPNGGDNGNDHEIDTERSSVESNLSIDENDPGPDPELCSTITIHERSCVGSNLSIDGNDPESCSTNTPQEVVSPLPVLDAPENTPLKVGQNGDLTGKPGLNLKLLSGKFQWFWKFGKNGGEALEATKSSVFGCDNKSEAASSGMDLSSKEESVNETTISLKNVGQSMLENIQVIECVLEQEKVATGHADNLSKKALVDRGQMTAMAALKELRKISNLLSEM